MPILPKLAAWPGSESGLNSDGNGSRTFGPRSCTNSDPALTETISEDRVATEQDSKQCSRCKETKLLAEFSRRKGLPRSACRACEAAASRAYYEAHRTELLPKMNARAAKWYLQNADRVKDRRSAASEQQLGEARRKRRDLYHANRERERARSRESYARHAERRRADSKAYREGHQDQVRSSQAVWRRENAERVRRSRAEWVRNNPEKVRACRKSLDARRRSKEAAGIGGPELSEWELAQKKVCYWCGVACAQMYEIDHYRPLARDGAHVIENLVISCRSCNRKKSSKDPLAFAREVGRLF